MNIQPINNNSYNTNFQKLVIKNPQEIPEKVYKAIVENPDIKFLADKMQAKGVDLIASYKPAKMADRPIPPKIYLKNAKQFFNKYFKYSEAPYNKNFSEFFTINNRTNPSEKYLLRELDLFEAYEVRDAAHEDICAYFNEIKEAKAKAEAEAKAAYKKA